MSGLGTQASISCVIRAQVIRSLWLRRRSARRRVFRCSWNFPERVVPQMKVKPRKASELDQPGLLGMQRQRKLPLIATAFLITEAPSLTDKLSVAIVGFIVALVILEVRSATFSQASEPLTAASGPVR